MEAKLMLEEIGEKYTVKKDNINGEGGSSAPTS